MLNAQLTPRISTGLFKMCRSSVPIHSNLTKDCSMAMRMTILALVLALVLMPLLSRAVDIGRVRQLAAGHNVTSILVFGDSSVDPGNNNILQTTFKGNFPPYGKNFFDGRPTGRFSNGRLATDFIGNSLPLHPFECFFYCKIHIFFFPANNPRLIVYFSKFDFCFLGFLIDIHMLSVRWWKMDVVSQVTSLVSEKMSKT